MFIFQESKVVEKKQESINKEDVTPVESGDKQLGQGFFSKRTLYGSSDEKTQILSNVKEAAYEMKQFIKTLTPSNEAAKKVISAFFNEGLLDLVKGTFDTDIHMMCFFPSDRSQTQASYIIVDINSLESSSGSYNSFIYDIKNKQIFEVDPSSYRTTQYRSKTDQNVLIDDKDIDRSRMFSGSVHGSRGSVERTVLEKGTLAERGILETKITGFGPNFGKELELFIYVNHYCAY